MTDLTESVFSEAIATPLGTVMISVTSTGTSTIAIADMPRTLRNGMTTELSTAALITTIPTSDSLRVTINCKLQNTNIQGSSSTGQFLDCVEWSSDDWHLTIGTEDSEILQMRYPKATLETNPYLVQYQKSGFIIALEMTNINEPVSMHLIVSAKSLPDQRDGTAWYFADVPHEDIKRVVWADYSGLSIKRKSHPTRFFV